MLGRVNGYWIQPEGQGLAPTIIGNNHPMHNEGMTYCGCHGGSRAELSSKVPGIWCWHCLPIAVPSTSVVCILYPGRCFSCHRECLDNLTSKQQAAMRSNLTSASFAAPVTWEIFLIELPAAHLQNNEKRLQYRSRMSLLSLKGPGNLLFSSGNVLAAVKDLTQDLKSSPQTPPNPFI